MITFEYPNQFLNVVEPPFVSRDSLLAGAFSLKESQNDKSRNNNFYDVGF